MHNSQPKASQRREKLEIIPPRDVLVLSIVRGAKKSHNWEITRENHALNQSYSRWISFFSSSVSIGNYKLIPKRLNVGSENLRLIYSYRMSLMTKFHLNSRFFYDHDDEFRWYDLQVHRKWNAMRSEQMSARYVHSSGAIKMHWIQLLTAIYRYPCTKSMQITAKKNDYLCHEDFCWNQNRN